MTTETPANGPPCSLVTVPVTVLTCAIACALHRNSPTSTMTNRVFIARCTGCWWTGSDSRAQVVRGTTACGCCPSASVGRSGDDGTVRRAGIGDFGHQGATVGLY